MEFTIKPIGFVEGGRIEPEDDDWDKERAVIALDKSQFGEQALWGIDDFSHIEVLFRFHHTDPASAETGARHPRGNTDWPQVGIFAQRAHRRPNVIGASVCTVEGVEGTKLHVSGLDAVDGTPVIDIKPVMSGFAPRGAFKEPDWAKEIMKTYW